MKKRIPKHVWRRAAIVRRAIKEIVESADVCRRCDGEGYMDRDDWIVTEDDGSRVCFACRGTGTARPRKYADPLKVRYAVAYRLVPAVERGDVDLIMREEDKAKTEVYWPILEDVYERALNAAEKVAGC